MRLAKKTSHGFTIIELLIASAVFSIVLMASQAGFIEIGRLFYKGVSVTETQNITSNILNGLKNDMQLASGVSLSQSANGYTYYCVGNDRYTVNVGHEVDLASESYAAGGNYGILRDTLSGDSACAAPCNTNCPAGTQAFNNPKELLGNKMRLVQFSLTQPNAAGSPNLYDVALIAAYGDDNALAYTDQNDPTSVYCVGSEANQEFCSISRLNSSLYRGVSQ